jgi:glutaredoxin
MENKYILYVRQACPFCVKATNMLNLRGIGHKVIALDQNLKILEDLKDAYGWKTVPMIFIREGEDCFRLIGGCSDLEEQLEKCDDVSDT